MALIIGSKIWEAFIGALSGFLDEGPVAIGPLPKSVSYP